MTAALNGTPSTSDSTVLATEVYRDKNVSNKSVSDKTVSNKTVSNMSVTDKNVSNKTVSDKTVSNKSVNDKTVSNKFVTNKTVSNKTVSYSSVSKKTVSDTNFTALQLTWPTLCRICLLQHVNIPSLSLSALTGTGCQSGWSLLCYWQQKSSAAQLPDSCPATAAACAKQQ